MRRSPKLLFAIVAGAALTLAARPAVAQSCSRGAIQQAVDEVKALRERLLATKKGSLDAGVMTRTGIFRYRLAGDKLERVQPIAMNARDFVDEWLQVDWNDARRWSDTRDLSGLEKEHDRLAALRDPKSQARPLFTYGAVRACRDDPKHFQVELELEPGEGSYFQLRQGENSFLMLAAATQPDARCKGADLDAYAISPRLPGAGVIWKLPPAGRGCRFAHSRKA
ncbi:MAG: hypothetical protein LAP21_13165 [Acidobacteriia bacterium]|nr:hypothetical protein [Terriglobia bacterium]